MIAAGEKTADPAADPVAGAAADPAAPAATDPAAGAAADTAADATAVAATDPAEGAGEQDLLLSGGFGRASNSARLGYLPIPLDHTPLAALAGIPVYVRVRPGEAKNKDEPHGDASGFRLHCSAESRMRDLHRQRLIESGVKFVYIRIADQSRFRKQMESQLREVATDSMMVVSEKSAIIYETSVELMNELLADPEGAASSPRLSEVSRAVATLVMNHSGAFTHLFAASHHDFYTATHMVNVASWMTPLAYAMGIRDTETLEVICRAGLLHDMGKLVVPEEVLNKRGRLSESEWQQIKRHPEAGFEYLSRYEGIPDLVMKVTLQHHERMDGTGYPKGLRGDEIDLVSRICAVVDSFDAMTAFRPFKEKTMSVQEALLTLQKETPAKYDPAVMEKWMGLVGEALRETDAGVEAPAPPPTGSPSRVGSGPMPFKLADRRCEPRRQFDCPGRAHVLAMGPNGVEEKPAFPIVAHSISRIGIGLLSPNELQLGETIRVYLNAPGWANRPLDGQTVRCRAHTDSWHEMGVKFCDAKSATAPADLKPVA